MTELKNRRKNQSQREEEYSQLAECVRRTQQDLNDAYARFNVCSDPDLIDACTFEINALRCRYAYLIRRIKELEQDREVAG